MTDFLMPRRKFLTGLFGLVAAPAVVKAANIMPVKVIQPEWKYQEIAYGFVMERREICRVGGGIRLSELRELLRPGLEKMIDEMYTEYPGYGKFLLTGDFND
jgi:hypothetical protein